MKIDTPRDLLFDQLRDIHDFENQLQPSFAELSVRATSPDLRSLLEDHGRECEDQRDRVRGIFSRHGVEIGSDKCKAIEGLIKGGDKHLDEATDPQVIDLLLIAHCNRIKHYEIAAYSFAASLADCLGFQDDAQLLEQSLQEEHAVKEALAQTAANVFDPCMLEHGRDLAAS
ncbi:ferritin-like domain-containing protein [Luteolibacter sp. Populi]|uniref:YciE/YciF ferroxidase family protein n=1 Tax=Luteolibacter sp. Populi TaxID=3230487 RepID=UPI00346596F3